MKPRVLMLHNRYLTRGGEDESTDLEVEILRENGHEVDLFEICNKEPSRITDKANIAIGAIWSKSSFETISRILASSRYDIVHVQNFFPLFSPSVYSAAKKADVPLVQSIRNYRLICPSANLFRNGHFCDDCVGKKFAFPSIFHACYRSSRLGTSTIAAMQIVNRLTGNWKNGVDRYIAVTEYVRDQLIRGGFPAGKIAVKPNFVKPPKSNLEIVPSRNFAMYVGRLTQEKGAHWLVQKWKNLDIDLRLCIIGDGDMPLSSPEGSDHIISLGVKPLEEVYKIMANARFVVLPSLWPEPFGRVIVEAFANGTPVLVARTGGAQELVEDGKNGFLYDPADSTDFALKVRRLTYDDELIEKMSKAARTTFETLYTSEANYKMLSRIYNDVLVARS